MLDWLKDKERSSPFAIPALYQPASKIPLEVWRASPSTSNGNEQSHRNINRDGIKLTLLAGIHRGMQYDSRAMRGIKVLSKHGIHNRDQHASHFRRAARAISRSGSFTVHPLAAYFIHLFFRYSSETSIRGSRLGNRNITPEPFEASTQRLRAVANIEARNRQR